MKGEKPVEFKALKGIIESKFFDVANVPKYSEDVIDSMSQLEKKRKELVITGRKMEVMKETIAEKWKLLDDRFCVD